MSLGPHHKELLCVLQRIYSEDYGEPKVLNGEMT